jgi:hypothetical protein
MNPAGFLRPPRSGDNLSPEDYRPALVRTGIQVSIHAILWIVVLAVIIFGVPAAGARFADLKFKVSWMTVLLLDISSFFIEFWFLLAFLIVILLAVDAPVSFYLRLRSSTMCCLWSGLMILLPSAVLALTCFALFLPWIKAREGATKEMASWESGNEAATELVDNTAQISQVMSPHTKILLFINVGGESLTMASKEPIYHVLNAEGKLILDLTPIKNGTRKSVKTEFTDSRVVEIESSWMGNRDSIYIRPFSLSRGTAKVGLESDSGRKEFFEIIVLKSAVAVLPGSTHVMQSFSKKPIKQIEVENNGIVSARIDPGDPKQVVIKGLARGFTGIRLTSAQGDPETLELVVHPEKITEDKVLILSAGKKNYRLRMSSEKVIAQVENSDDKIVEISTVTENPEQIRFTTLKPGFCRLKLVAGDNFTESFAIFVRDTKE